MIIYNIKTKAFTLVELIITITILAILATIAFINLGNYPADSRDAVRKSDLRTIEKAMTIYYIENGRYPTPDKDPVDGKTYFGEKAFQELGKINKLPLDPTTGKPYRYISLGVGYILVAELENGELFRVDHSRLAFQTCGMDLNSLYNKYGGNAGVDSNVGAFTAMKADGTIKSWGSPYYGGTGYPTEKGFIKVFPTFDGFLAINPYGKISYWGDGSINVPEEEGFIKIYSNSNSYTAMKVDGTLKTFGKGSSSQAPDGEFREVYSTSFSFAAITKDGEIKTWGYPGTGGTGGPSGNGWVKIYSNNNSFSALNQDGTIFTWPTRQYSPPSGKKFKKIIPHYPFIGLDVEGTMHIWGHSNSLSYHWKKDGWIDIFYKWGQPIGINNDGHLYSNYGKKRKPENYKKIFIANNSIIILDNNGRIYDFFNRNTGLPNSTGWKDIVTTPDAFTAINEDGSLYSKGFYNDNNNMIPLPNAPEGKFVKVFSNTGSFIAMDEKGCLKSWGHPDFGGTNAPTDCGRIEVNGSRVDDLEDCSQM
ncbi:hypothetical protein DLH72_05440 [Candidatus Gracilibacteria bacterium]|nr:MAG: hypothetical protein DLH72_05440 [Candidatus Gracilibacteria bacterium]